MANDKKRGLGKGISSLMSGFDFDTQTDDIITKTIKDERKDKMTVVQLDISHVRPNPNQPRKFFDEEALAGLAVAFICYPYVQKYVIEPYYKAIGRDNPEYDYLKPEGMEDIPLFNDKGGEEAPVVKAKTKGKNKKTIS